jgi:hypothetical protein
MWETILKKPITVGKTRIGMKPMPEEDCCEQARKEWIKFLIEQGFEETITSDWSGTGTYIDYITNSSCKEFYYILKHKALNKYNNFGPPWPETAQAIVDNWNRCEGK